MAREVESRMKLIINAGGLKEGAALSRVELNETRRAMREMEDPIDKVQKRIDILGKALEKSGVPADEAAEYLARYEEKLKTNLPASRAMVAAQDRVADTMRSLETPLKTADRRLEDFKKDLALANTPADKAADALERYEKKLRDTAAAAERSALGLRDYKDILREMESPTDRTERKVRELDESMRRQGVSADLAAKHLADYRHHLNAVGGSSRSLTSSVGEAVPALGRATSLLATGGPLLLGVVAATGAAAIGYRSAASAVDYFSDRMQKLDDRLDRSKGLNIDLSDLERFTYAADRGAGLSAEQALGSLQKFQKKLGEAGTTGGGDAAKVINDLGLSVKQLQAEGPIRAIGMIGDKLNSIKEPADRAYLTTKLFGKEAGDLAVLLNEGSRGLDDYAARWDKLSGGVTSMEAERIAMANDAMGDLGISVDGAADRFLLGLSPAIIAGTTAMLGLRDAGGDAMSLFEQIGLEAAYAFGGVAGTIKDVIVLQDALFSMDAKRALGAIRGDGRKEAVEAVIDAEDRLATMQFQSVETEKYLAQLKKDEASSVDDAERYIAIAKRATEWEIDGYKVKIANGKDVLANQEALRNATQRLAGEEASLAAIEDARAKYRTFTSDEALKKEDDATKAVDRTIESLKREIATLEDRKDAFTIEELEKSGAKPMQLDDVRDLQARRDVLQENVDREEKLEQKQKDRERTGKSTIESLEKEIATYKDLASGKKNAELQRLGVDNATIERISQLQKERDGLKELDDARRKSEDKLKASIESIKTPEDRFEEEKRQLDSWLQAEKITGEQFEKLMDKARKDANIDIKVDATSVESGSAEAYKILAAWSQKKSDLAAEEKRKKELEDRADSMPKIADQKPKDSAADRLKDVTRDFAGKWDAMPENERRKPLEVDAGAVDRTENLIAKQNREFDELFGTAASDLATSVTEGADRTFGFVFAAAESAAIRSAQSITDAAMKEAVGIELRGDRDTSSIKEPYEVLDRGRNELLEPNLQLPRADDSNRESLASIAHSLVELISTTRSGADKVADTIKSVDFGIWMGVG